MKKASTFSEKNPTFSTTIFRNSNKLNTVQLSVQTKITHFYISNSISGPFFRKFTMHISEALSLSIKLLTDVPNILSLCTPNFIPPENCAF